MVGPGLFEGPVEAISEVIVGESGDALVAAEEGDDDAAVVEEEGDFGWDEGGGIEVVELGVVLGEAEELDGRSRVM